MSFNRSEIHHIIGIIEQMQPDCVELERIGEIVTKYWERCGEEMNRLPWSWEELTKKSGAD